MATGGRFNFVSRIVFADGDRSTIVIAFKEVLAKILTGANIERLESLSDEGATVDNIRKELAEFLKAKRAACVLSAKPGKMTSDWEVLCLDIVG